MAAIENQQIGQDTPKTPETDVTTDAEVTIAVPVPHLFPEVTIPTVAVVAPVPIQVATVTTEETGIEEKIVMRGMIGIITKTIGTREIGWIGTIKEDMRVEVDIGMKEKGIEGVNMEVVGGIIIRKEEGIEIEGKIEIEIGGREEIAETGIGKEKEIEIEEIIGSTEIQDSPEIPGREATKYTTVPEETTTRDPRKSKEPATTKTRPAPVATTPKTPLVSTKTGPPNNTGKTTPKTLTKTLGTKTTSKSPTRATLRAVTTTTSGSSPGRSPTRTRTSRAASIGRTVRSIRPGPTLTRDRSPRGRSR